MSVQLKFPHARLMVYEALVHRRLGCVQSIISCAHEMGLLAADRLRELKLPVDSTGCGSLFAAEQVVHQCLADRNCSDQSLATRLWSEIKNAIELYKAQSQLVHDHNAGSGASVVECSHMAPVVMDLVLQHLQPYV